MHYVKAVLPRVGRAVFKPSHFIFRQLNSQIPPIPKTSENPIEEKNEKKEVYKILAIDGGGIRGVIPATVLAEIEKQTGKPISELFDYVAGTSTGGLLALGLNLPDKVNPQKPVYSANDLLKLYEKHGSDIFTSSLELSRDVAKFSIILGVIQLSGFAIIAYFIINSVEKSEKNESTNSEDRSGDIVTVQEWDEFRDMLIYYGETQMTRRERDRRLANEAKAGVLGGLLILGSVVFAALLMKVFDRSVVIQALINKYNHEKLEEILKSYLGDASLKNSITEVLVTTYDAKKHTSKFLTRNSATLSPEDNFLMREAVRATSAAPAFFQPYRRDESIYIDGGVFANNPSMCAYADAQKHLKNKKIFLVSLGTGVHKPKEQGTFEKFGFFQWLKNDRLGRAVMEGSSTAVHSQMKELLSEENYSRIQIQTSENIGLDDVAPDNIERLKEYGKRCVEENREEIKRICRRLQ